MTASDREEPEYVDWKLPDAPRVRLSKPSRREFTWLMSSLLMTVFALLVNVLLRLAQAVTEDPDLLINLAKAVMVVHAIIFLLIGVSVLLFARSVVD